MVSDAWKGPDMKHCLTPLEMCQKHITRTSEPTEKSHQKKKNDLENYSIQFEYYFFKKSKDLMQMV